MADMAGANGHGWGKPSHYYIRSEALLASYSSGHTVAGGDLNPCGCYETSRKTLNLTLLHLA